MPNPLPDLIKRAGLNQSELAARVGVHPSQVNRWVQSKRLVLKLDNLLKLAHALGVDPQELMPDDIDYREQVRRQDAGVAESMSRIMGSLDRHAVLKQRAPEAPPAGDRMPVLVGARGGSQLMFAEDGALDWTPTPHYLREVRGAYAAWVVGDSMMPRFRPGQVLHVHPSRPPSAGAGVVIQLSAGEVMVKEFVRSTAQGVWVREYHPDDRTFLLEAERVVSCHVVLGLQEP